MSFPSLQNVVISTIKPSEKTDHPALLEASMFDLVTADAYLTLVLFYRPSEGASADNLVHHLKESLSRVLVPYYPFAGRWIKTYDVRVRALECNDEGVPFIETSIDEEMDSVVNFKNYVSIEWLGGFRHVGLDPRAFNQNVDFPLPSAFVQVTRFKCGGIALHAAISHMTADGFGMSIFMKAWSEMEMLGRVSSSPTHDRSLVHSLPDFLQLAGVADSFPPPGAHEKEDTKNVAKVVGTVPLATTPDPGALLKFPGNRNTEVVAEKTLHVKGEAIQALKREAAKRNMQLTTLDLIVSHIWQSLSNIPESVDQLSRSTVTVAVEGRKRFYSPPLPEKYTGNVFMPMESPARSVSESSMDSHLSAAGVIHDFVRSFNTSNWQALPIAYFTALAKGVEFKLDPTVRCVGTTSWFRFGLYDLDFGQGFGNPVYATSNVLSPLLHLANVRIYPPPPGLSNKAAATVHFCLHQVQPLSYLFSNEEFLSLFLDVTSLSSVLL